MTQPPHSRTPAIIGFLIAGAVILGASFFVSTLDGSSDDDVPPLSILHPASGDSVSNPLSVMFRTTDALRLDPGMGWIAGDLHVHAMAGSREIMPAASDIVVTDSAFVWRLPDLDPGTHRLYLTWAGRHHGNLRGIADTVIVHVR
jgi:hypothetical protein